MEKRAITLFAIDKKSKNQVRMLARTRGLKKAKKIGAAPFSLWCHPRRRCLKKRRRWFQLYAEWKIRLSLGRSVLASTFPASTLGHYFSLVADSKIPTVASTSLQEPALSCKTFKMLSRTSQHPRITISN